MGDDKTTDDEKQIDTAKTGFKKPQYGRMDAHIVHFHEQMEKGDGERCQCAQDLNGFDGSG
ncbi:hypothetical protein GCM10027299_04730 [Larkinella ripae]